MDMAAVKMCACAGTPLDGEKMATALNYRNTTDNVHARYTERRGSFSFR